MNPERFRAIVEAYGAEPSRWPAAERVAAEAFALENEAAAKALLMPEAGLDRLLDGYRVTAADGGLTGRVIASARSGRRTLASLLIWRGLGMAGIGVAGALAGALLVTALAPMMPVLSPGGHSQMLTAFDTSVDDYGFDAQDFE